MDSFVPSVANDTSCAGTLELVQSGGLKALIIVRTTLDFAGLIAVAFGLLFRTRPFLLHGNARLLVYFHLFYCNLASVGYFGSHLADIFRLLQKHDDPCDYKMKIWAVFSIRQLTFAGAFGQICTIFLIAIERLISTFSQGYERAKSRKVVISVCIVKIIIVFGFCYGFVLSGMNFEEKMSEFATIRGKSTADAIQIITYSAMAVELLSIVLFHFLYFINLKTRVALRRNVSASRLPEQVMAMKYQATENRRTISFFFPIAWTHFILYLIRSVTVTIYPLINNYTPLNHAFYEESTCWMSVYTLFVGIMITGRFTKFGRGVRKCLSGKICAAETEFISVKSIALTHKSKEIDHFKQLHNMFERGTL